MPLRMRSVAVATTEVSTGFICSAMRWDLPWRGADAASYSCAVAASGKFLYETRAARRGRRAEALLGAAGTVRSSSVLESLIKPAQQLSTARFESPVAAQS